MLYLVSFIGGAVAMLLILFVVAKIKLKKKEDKNI